jgi:sugar-specific transcriptional regulator TrmB
MKKMESSLKAIGLTEGEIKVYSAILDLGTSTINKIHEKTGFERRTIYDVINKLIEKGLISYTLENKRKTYQCSHPNKLKEEINNKEKELNELKSKLPEFTSQFNASKPEIRAEVFRGIEGIKAIFEDMLNHKETYFIGGGAYIKKRLPFYWENYNKRRENLKAKWVSLVRADLPQKEIIIGKGIFTRILPEDFSGSPSVIFIYGNKVANVLWSEDFFAFVIESKEIAENYKRYHSYLWKLAKK